MSESEMLEKRLRCQFRKALRDYKTGNVVDVLIGILKEEYILLAKEPCSCLDCIHHSERIGIPSNYCDKYGSFIFDFSRAYDCDEYFSGRGEARKSLASFHNDLSGEWIIK